MARIKGVKNFYVADVTVNTEEEYTADTPEKMERIIGIDIDTKVDSEDVYSDDEVEETVYGVVEKTGKVTLNYLTPESKLKLFGGEIDANGIYFPPGDLELKHKAVAFEMATTSGKKKYAWYYDVVFEYPQEKGETQENKPKLQQVEISFKCYKNRKINTHLAELDMNGASAKKEAAAAWFEAVPTKTTV